MRVTKTVLRRQCQDLKGFDHHKKFRLLFSNLAIWTSPLDQLSHNPTPHHLTHLLHHSGHIPPLMLASVSLSWQPPKPTARGSFESSLPEVCWLCFFFWIFFSSLWKSSPIFFFFFNYMFFARSSNMPKKHLKNISN